MIMLLLLLSVIMVMIMLLMMKIIAMNLFDLVHGICLDLTIIEIVIIIIIILICSLRKIMMVIMHEDLCGKSLRKTKMVIISIYR